MLNYTQLRKQFIGSSEERAECGVLLQRIENSVAKHVDTFNASESRESRHTQIEKVLVREPFLLCAKDENPNCVSNLLVRARSEQSAECFYKELKTL